MQAWSSAFTYLLFYSLLVLSDNTWRMFDQMKCRQTQCDRLGLQVYCISSLPAPFRLYGNGGGVKGGNGGKGSSPASKPLQHAVTKLKSILNNCSVRFTTYIHY